MRQIVRRFDEVLAEKANKSAVTDLRTEIVKEYVTKLELGLIGHENKRALAEVNLEIKEILRR